jgi:hypothetical protein
MRVEATPPIQYIVKKYDNKEVLKTSSLQIAKEKIEDELQLKEKNQSKLKTSVDIYV